MLLLSGTLEFTKRNVKKTCYATRVLYVKTVCKNVRHNENNFPDMDGTVLDFAGQGSELPGAISYCAQHKFYILKELKFSIRDGLKKGMYLVPIPTYVCFIPINMGIKTFRFTGKSTVAKNLSEFLIILLILDSTGNLVL